MQLKKETINILECMYVLTMDTETNKVIKVSRPQYGNVTSPHELQLIAAAGYDVGIPRPTINDVSNGTRNAALLRLQNGEKKDIKAENFGFEKTFISTGLSCNGSAVKVL